MTVGINISLHNETSKFRRLLSETLASAQYGPDRSSLALRNGVLQLSMSARSLHESHRIQVFYRDPDRAADFKARFLEPIDALSRHFPTPSKIDANRELFIEELVMVERAVVGALDSELGA